MDEGSSPLSGKEDKNISRFVKACFSEMADPATQDSEAVMRTLMDSYLEQPVILDPQVAQEPAGALAHVHRELHSQAGCSVKKCLLSPDTPIFLLTRIKNTYQKTAQQSSRQADRRAAAVVYFGALASALVFHHEKTTSYTRAEIREKIGKLLAKPWIDTEIRGLLEQATKALDV